MKIIAGAVIAGAVAAGVAVVSGGGGAPLSAERPPEKKFIPVAFRLSRGNWIDQDGPALSSVVHEHSQPVFGPSGDFFMLSAVSQQILAYVEAEKRIYSLCTGTVGYRDGPAGEAQVGLVYHDDCPLAGAIDADGRLFFSDAKSGTIRVAERREDGSWHISTVLGAGKRAINSIKPGEWVPAREVAGLGGPVPSITTSKDGSFLFSTAHNVYRYRLKDARLTCVTSKPLPIRSARIVADDAGNLYALVGRGAYLKVERNGGVTFLGGFGGWCKSYRTTSPEGPAGKDGPALEAVYWCPSRLEVAPDGSCLYVGAGDEATLRRLKPIGPQGRVSTLMRDGTWKECERHRQEGQLTGVPLLLPSGRCYVRSVAQRGRGSDVPKGTWLYLLEGPDIELLRRAYGIKAGGAQ